MADLQTADPSNPRSRSDDTMRLKAGMPVDPNSTQRLNLDLGLEANGEPPLPLAGTPQGTQKVSLPEGGGPPIRIQKSDLPAEATGRAEAPRMAPTSPSPFGWKVPLLLGSLVVLGAAAYLVLARGPVPPPPPVVGNPAEPIPAGAQVYLDQAKAGDAHAMRMLGVMYYYGLNVPQDREKGLYWYRKAAEKGSDAAKAELDRLEAGSTK